MSVASVESILKDTFKSKYGQWSQVIGDSMKGTPIKSIEDMTADEMAKLYKSKGIAGTLQRLTANSGDKEYGLGKAIKEAYSKDGDGEGGLDLLAVAGSYMGVNAAYRAASGGGIYKDRNGNANLVGIPFV